jgi:hypothetical protein
MPSIAVRFDRKPAFSWTGNEVEVAGVLGAWRDIAGQQGLVPEEFAIETVWFWDTADFMANPPDQQAWMLGAVYFILSLDEPNRPGKIANYVPVWDFDIDIRRGHGGIEAVIDVRRPSMN